MSFRHKLKPVLTSAGVAASPPHAGLAGDEQVGGLGGVMTGESQNAEPAPCSQQPRGFLFTLATGNSLLAGVVGAWLPGGCG